jgi:hypothetical protein
MDMGIVCITTIESATPSWVDSLKHELLAEPGPIKLEDLGDTAQVQRANRCQGIFKIVASSPTFDAELCFSLDVPQEGHYSIRYKPRGPTEHGKTLEVHPVAKDEQSYRLPPALARYEIRFAVKTIASAPPRSRMWLLGLSNINTAEYEAEPEDEHS